MSNEPQPIIDDETLLLLVSEDLPEAEHRRWMARVDADPQLRERFDRLESDLARLADGLETLDASVRQDPRRAEQQALAVLHRWHDGRFAGRGERRTPRKAISRWWVYPLAAAALLMLAVLMFRDDPIPNRTSELTSNTSNLVSLQDQVAQIEMIEWQVTLFAAPRLPSDVRLAEVDRLESAFADQLDELDFLRGFASR